MRKWAFVCPLAAFLLIETEIIFKDIFSGMLPILVLLALFLGAYLILEDKKLLTIKQKLFWIVGYLVFIFVVLILGGFVTGLAMGVMKSMPPSS